MQSNRHRILAPFINGTVGDEYSKQPGDITRMVADAVARFNETTSLYETFRGKDVDERLIQESEEEATKVFLDGILDIMQRANS